MKILCIPLFSFLVLASCTTRKTISSINISTTISTPLPNKEALIVEVEAIDNDGISSVSISLDAFNYFNSFNNISGTQWHFAREFSLSTLALTNAEIEVKLIDNNGNVKVEFRPIIH